MTTFLRDYSCTRQSVNHMATILGYLSDRRTIFVIIKHEGSEADKKVQGVRTLAIKPNHLTSTPGPAWWRGDNQLLKAALDLHLNHACCGTHVSALSLSLSPTDKQIFFFSERRFEHKLHAQLPDSFKKEPNFKLKQCDFGTHKPRKVHFLNLRHCGPRGKQEVLCQGDLPCA